MSPSLARGNLLVMSEATLDGCFAKLARARKHMDDLFAALDGFDLDADVRKLYDQQEQTFTFTAAIGADPPPELGVIIGDWAHNVRSALDHLVWQLVLLRGQRQPGGQHQFPIADTAKAWKRQSPKMLDGLLDEDKGYIESVQPFREMPGDFRTHFLGRLAWISNTDKHRVIHPAVGLLQSEAWWNQERPKEMSFPYNKDVATIDEIEVTQPQLTTEHQTVARVRITPGGPDPVVDFDATPILLITELELDLVDLHAILAQVNFIFYAFAPQFGKNWPSIPPAADARADSW